MKKLLVVLLVLGALLVGADRLAAYFAGQAVAQKVRSTAGLTTDPDVRVTGFPFLTQAVAGRYDRIAVDAKDLDRGGVHLSALHVDLLGARIPLRSALSGSVPSVPVEGLRGTVTLAFVDLVRQRTSLQVRPLGGQLVSVSGSLSLLGQTVTASTRSSVSVEGRDLVIAARSVTVGGQTVPLSSELGGQLDLRVPIGSLPYGLRLSSVRVTPAGVVVDATSGPTVLTAR